MFTINVDESEDKFIKEVKEQNLPWPILSDIKTSSGIEKQYNIIGIPAVFIISPEGILLKKNVRGEELIEYLDQIFIK